MLTTTEEQNQDVVAATCSPHSSARSSPSTNVTCYRCNIKGHLIKDCQKRGTGAVNVDTGPGTARENEQGENA